MENNNKKLELPDTQGYIDALKMLQFIAVCERAKKDKSWTAWNYICLISFIILMFISPAYAIGIAILGIITR